MRFAKAYIDTLLQLRVDPAREATAWFDEQLKRLRSSLEERPGQAHRELPAARDRLRRRAPRCREQRACGPVGRSGPGAGAQTSSGTAGSSRRAAPRAGAARPTGCRTCSTTRSSSGSRATCCAANAGCRSWRRSTGRITRSTSGRCPENAEPARETRRRDGESRGRRRQLGAPEPGPRRRQSTQAMDAQRKRMLGLKQSRNELTVLRRNVESAERAYDTALQRSVASQVDSRVNQTNVTRAQPGSRAGQARQPAHGPEPRLVGRGRHHARHRHCPAAGDDRPARAFAGGPRERMGCAVARRAQALEGPPARSSASRRTIPVPCPIPAEASTDEQPRQRPADRRLRPPGARARTAGSATSCSRTARSAPATSSRSSRSSAPAASASARRRCA